jgi:hypothetical protein
MQPLLSFPFSLYTLIHPILGEKARLFCERIIKETAGKHFVRETPGVLVFLPRDCYGG